MPDFQEWFVIILTCITVASVLGNLYQLYNRPVCPQPICEAPEIPKCPDCTCEIPDCSVNTATTECPECPVCPDCICSLEGLKECRDELQAYKDAGCELPEKPCVAGRNEIPITLKTLSSCSFNCPDDVTRCEYEIIDGRSTKTGEIESTHALGIGGLWNIVSCRLWSVVEC